MDVLASYSERGFRFAPTYKRGEADRPGIRSFDVPVNAGVEYVIILSTDSLNSMGVPIKLRVTDNEDPKKVFVRDERALATSIAVVQWTPKFNGSVSCYVDLLESSVFERGLKCDWFMAISRRATSDK